MHGPQLQEGAAGPHQARMTHTEANISSIPWEEEGGMGRRQGGGGRREGGKSASSSFQQPHSQLRLWYHL